MSDYPTGPARQDSTATRPLDGRLDTVLPHARPDNPARNVTPIKTTFDPPTTSSPTIRPGVVTPTRLANPEFRSETTAPSPPAPIATPTSATDPSPIHTSFSRSGSLRSASHGLRHQASSSSLVPVSRTPSIKKALGSGGSGGSATSSIIPSPVISALGDMTPLPSPLMAHHSPGPWRAFARRPSAEGIPPELLSESPRTSLEATLNAARRGSSSPSAAEDRADGTNKPRHGRDRSISLYAPDSLTVPRRHATVSGPHGSRAAEQEPQMRRELHLAGSRGITAAVAKPPTPPPSESSRDASDGATSDKANSVGGEAEVFEALDRHDGKRRRWRAVKFLGQGTFSRVVLATSQLGEDGAAVEGEPDRKTLVAVKVLEHGPRGGASEDRIEMSLKRELEIMKGVDHPSLVHLRAWSIEPSRALLVLSYCPGGDLFDVATAHREALTPSLMRRMFAELVGAVKYLHERLIVHRDIKLENVLVNLTPAELADPSMDWTTYPHSVITLTDLGLSRRITPDEKLETRCGSDDYAAPEVIMGQPYDGRATDAWSLGVLLYALLEARLPFDPHPDAHRMRSRTSHRIARVEWRWVEFGGGDEGDHEADLEKFERRGVEGAREIAEGLLKRARSRWTVERVAGSEWVTRAFKGEVEFRPEEKGAEV